MPTIDQLHEAFAQLESQAPTSCDPIERPARSRRVPMLAAAAVVVSVAVAAVAVGVRHDGTTAPPVAGTSVPAPPMTTGRSATNPPVVNAMPSLREFAFSVGGGRGFTVTYTNISRDYQGAQLDLASGDRSTVFWVAVYPPGGWRPSRPNGATDARVDGHRGFSGNLATDGPGMVSVSDGPNPHAVAWEYAANAWAIVQQLDAPVRVSVPTAIDIARAVDFTRPHAAYVPSQISYLPTGYSFAGVSYALQDNLRTTTISFAASRRLPMNLVVGTGGTGGTNGAALLGVPISFDGWTGNYDAPCGSLWISRGGVYVSVSEVEMAPTCSSTRSLSRAELLRIVQRLVFAPRPADPATWFPTATAIP